MIAPPKVQSKAFTLIELLIVIAIIGILSVAIVTIKPGEGIDITSAEHIASSMAKSARAEAILRNTQTRLIIYNQHPKNNGELDKYLRYMGIVYLQEQNTNTNNAQQKWVAACNGIYLPNGVYFNDKISTKGGQLKINTPQTMKIPYPRSNPVVPGEEGSVQWYYYTFAPTGFCSKNSGARFIVSTGNIKDAGSDIILNEEKLGGFIIHKSGNITIAEDPNDLK
jgi:prepilin-type N-terminal cleavage/methylation domain-containing protein